MDLNTRISDMTLGELLEALTLTLGQQPRTVSGLEGIAQLFGVSVSTAKRIKASGIIDKAISQSGRTIVTDADLALKLFRSSTKGRQ